MPALIHFHMATCVLADAAGWEFSADRAIKAGIALLAVLVIGGILLVAGWKLLRRHRLAMISLMGVIATAIYFGVIGWNPEGGYFRDPVGFWVVRVFVAALIVVLLRFMDRGILVPILTRGGRVVLPRFVHQMANIVLAIFAVLIYGSIAFGWDIDKFLAGSAVVSIVLGLALQESLGNFFSGLVMQASPPFSIGHRYSCATYEGDVVDMTWRAVTLHTDDDNYVILPNATVAKSEIVNYNVPSRATAKMVKVGLEYDLPPADAMAVLKAAALETPGVIPEPAPVIFLLDFADSAVIYGVKFWITDAGAHENIQHQLRVHMWYRLKEKNYNIPYPIRTVEHSSHIQKNRMQQLEARSRRIAAIENVPLFAMLSPEQKTQLADSANELYLAAGQVLFKQGDQGDSFYIIDKGQVEVLVNPEAASGGEGAAAGGGAGQARVVATLGPGDFFGEMSAFTGQPRTATIRALTSITCVEIEKRDLLAIFESDGSLMEKVSEIIARRHAERDAVRDHPGSSPEPEAVVKEQKSLLGRMMRFFRLGGMA